MKQPEYPNPSPQRSSHVTNAPEAIQGEPYDPQLRLQYANEPKVVHATRAVDVAELPASEENIKRQKASQKAYPHLNLSEGEFVILDIKRHPIGMLFPIAITSVVAIVVIMLLILYPADSSNVIAPLPPYEAIIIPAVLAMVLVGLGGFIAVWVYLQNQFFMTNESVIQEIQNSLFSRHEQTVSLGSIEDASFEQHGILQTMLNYGRIRLSTEGEETTYRFSYVSDPRKQIAILNNAIEAFKNGRPVTPHDN